MRGFGFGQNGVYGQPDMEPLRLQHLMARHPMTGGNLPAMPAPMTGGPGQIQPMQFTTGGNLPAQGGYDSGGINPGGMYTGGRLPPMQSGYPMQPQGLAAMFRGYSPYRYG